MLGLASGADEADIRRAKRTLSLATHPDKIGDAPGAAEAFNLVTEVGRAPGPAPTLAGWAPGQVLALELATGWLRPRRVPRPAALAVTRRCLLLPAHPGLRGAGRPGKPAAV